MFKGFARLTCLGTALAGSLFCGSAFAAACGGVYVGTSQTSDVTFASLSSDACVVTKNNAQQGPDGNTSGFDPVPFGSGSSPIRT